jgi:hypothetical protein
LNENTTNDSLNAIKHLKEIQMNLNKESNSESLLKEENNKEQNENNLVNGDELNTKKKKKNTKKTLRAAVSDTAENAKKLRSRKTPSLREIAYEIEQEKNLKPKNEEELEKILEKTPQDALIDNFFDSVSPAKKKAAKKGVKSKGIEETNDKQAEILLKTLKELETGSTAASKTTLSSILSGETVIEPKKTRGRKPKAPKKVKIIPLGGLEQIGMNITAFEYEDSIFVVDCGLAFPSDDMLGIDLVIPDISYLKDNYLKVKGFCITHGHEDHIGSLPYILKQLNVPVYGTKLTLALINKKLVEHGIDKTSKLIEVKYGQTVELGDFKVEFIKTNHSIADSAALAIFSPAGIIFHTGDFKIDYTPVFGESNDLQRMAEIGKQGCLAMLCESTNAAKPGFTMSEKTVGKTFDLIFAEHRNKRILVATFASNVDRVQQIINTAYKHDRKVVVEGRSMVNVIGVAGELNYINIPEGTLIDIDHLKDYPPEKTVIITTGSQGESMAALSRMSSSLHKKVTITSDDVVIMSSSPIPGNEKAVNKVINELSIKGAEVIFQDTHVSGHACQEEIKLMYSLLKPKYSLPIHGEYRHRLAQRGIAEAMGMARENVLIMSSGDVVEVSEKSCEVVNHVEAGSIFVDGLGVGDVGNIVLRDRQNLAQNGIIIVAMSLERGTNRLLSGPDIISRGFVYIRESGDLIGEAEDVVRTAVRDCLAAGVNDWIKMKAITRDALSDFLWKKIKRNPVILPIIMDIHDK